jgi:hypothetical protein
MARHARVASERAKIRGVCELPAVKARQKERKRGGKKECFLNLVIFVIVPF